MTRRLLVLAILLCLLRVSPAAGLTNSTPGGAPPVVPVRQQDSSFSIDREKSSDSTQSEHRRLWAEPIVEYLQSLARPDGGFGWNDQPDAHLTPTFAVIGSYYLLGQTAPNPDELAQFVRAHHPLLGENSEVNYSSNERRSFTYQQVQGLQWLGKEAGNFRKRVRDWKPPFNFPKYYELGANPIFKQVVMVLICRSLLDMPVADSASSIVEYLLSRQRPNGSFNNTPTEDGGDGSVLNTWWGIKALSILGRTDTLRNETVDWLQSTQHVDGGFTYQPGTEVAVVDDVVYTWAAIRALDALGAEPSDREGCIRHILSLWNADGGLGNRPGLPSQPMATYYALDALKELNALHRLSEHYFSTSVQKKPTPEPLPSDLKTFTVQVQAQGNGSPEEAVAIADALKIHLWGAKNADPDWLAAAQATADQKEVPVTFFPSNEDYGLYVHLPGVGRYSHLSDPMSPPDSTELLSRIEHQQDVIPWRMFKRHYVMPLEEAGGRMVAQVFSNEVLTRILLNDTVESRTGYAAISTFHHGQNFAFLWPYLFRYRHEIPFVALQDAHGDEAWWWADDLVGYRTIFLAEEPTWEGWLKALKNNWVVAVRHDDLTRFRTRMLGGAPGVQKFVREHEEEWKWWGEEPEDIQRPWVSVVAVAPDDRFEVARPEHGVTIRVRCWWRGRRKRTEPVVELVDLSVDSEPVSATLVERRNGQGQVTDHYHTYHLANPVPGTHTVHVTVRKIDSGEQSTRTIQFTVPADE